MQETKELNEWESISPLNPEDRRVKMVLLGSSVAYDVDVITSHPQVMEAS